MHPRRGRVAPVALNLLNGTGRTERFGDLDQPVFVQPKPAQEAANEAFHVVHAETLETCAAVYSPKTPAARIVSAPPVLHDPTQQATF